jgi:hypothetical protein
MEEKIKKETKKEHLLLYEIKTDVLKEVYNRNLKALNIHSV